MEKDDIEETVSDMVLKTKAEMEISDEVEEDASAKLDLSSGAKNDRISRLKGLSMKLNNPQAVNEMEREPAFMRRGVEMNDVPHSSESNSSAYYLGTSEDGLPELKKDNSFLHGNDKVD